MTQVDFGVERVKGVEQETAAQNKNSEKILKVTDSGVLRASYAHFLSTFCILICVSPTFTFLLPT